MGGKSTLGARVNEDADGLADLEARGGMVRVM